MAGAEASIERWVTEKAVSQYGVQSAKWGVSGWPDRVFLLPGGKPLLIEFKAPGAALMPRQAYRADFLKRMGYDVECYDNRDLALKAIGDRVRSYFERGGT